MKNFTGTEFVNQRESTSRRSFLTTINKWGSGSRQIGCGRNLHQPSVLDLLAQPPLGADAIAVADDEHPDHLTQGRSRAGRCRCRTAPASREDRSASA